MQKFQLQTIAYLYFYTLGLFMRLQYLRNDGGLAKIAR
jgi:hypothetical protein